MIHFPDFPRYFGWNVPDTTVPQLYWNVYSNEQRIHAICREIGKLVQYADMLGIRTTELAQVLNDIQEGKLDPFIVTAIEQWFEENQPFIMQTLADHEQRITDNANDISALDTRLSGEIDALDTRLSGEITDLEGLLQALRDYTDTNVLRIDTTIGDGFDDQGENSITDWKNEVNDEIGEGFNAQNTIAENIERLNDYKDARTESIYLAPVYMGDFIVHLQFGSCVRVGDRIYAFCACDGQEENTSQIRIFNIASNSEEQRLTGKTIGHANSAAYDSVRNCFWICPSYTYSGGVATATNDLYVYDTAFNSKSNVSMPINNIPFGVSFDHVTRTVYAICTTGTNDMIVYKMGPDESAFTQHCIVWQPDFNYANRTRTWQDCCVYNNIMYIVRPEGTMYSFRIDNLEPTDRVKILASYRIGYIDAGNAWQMGEIEGMEFAANGCMYMARNWLYGITDYGFNYPYNNAFVTEISIGDSRRATPNVAYEQTIHNTMTLSTASIAKFALGQSEIRTINQVNNSVRTFSTVRCDDDIYEGNTIRIVKKAINIQIGSTGNYGCRNIVLRAPSLGILVENGGRLRFRSSEETMAIETADIGTTVIVRNNGTIEMTSNMTSFIRTKTMPSIIAMLISQGTPTSLAINGVSKSSGLYWSSNDA